LMKTDAPFFSIVVPTRNRSSLLVQSALKSILRQAFDDFEIVVCDNASTDNTGEAVRSIQDPRIRFFHSSEWIPKEDFFQWSLEHARGKYSTLFFDDDAMTRSALDKSFRILQKVDAEVLVYSRACVYHFPNWHEEHQKNVLTIPPFTGKLSVIDSQRHLEIIFERMDILIETPMVTNAFYRTSFVQSLIKKYGRLFPHGHMGDYNMACWSLANTKEFLYFDFPLAVFGHWKENTTAQLHDLQTTMPEYQEWIAWITHHYLAKMPMKAYTWLNCVAAAILDMKKRLQLPCDLDWTTYFSELKRELQLLKNKGIPVEAQEGEYSQIIEKLPAPEREKIRQAFTRGRKFVLMDRKRELLFQDVPEQLPPSLVGRKFMLFHGDSYGFQNVLEATEVFEELAFHFAKAFPPKKQIDAGGVGQQGTVLCTKAPDETDIQRRFQQGNYASVAMTGGRENWETYASLGLVGRTQDALDGLSLFDHEEARFFSAVAHWIGGNEEAAIRGLEKIATLHARNLLTLTRKRKINVLAQLPWRRTGAQDILVGMLCDPKFHVQNISFHPADLRSEPYANIHKYYSRQQAPDFYICQMVEWHLIPPNLQELPCPVIGQTADYDLHIQAVYPWLQLFDEMIVCDPDEWEDVRRLVSAPVSTFPKSFCVPRHIPLIFTGERENDLFISGTMKSPYNPDKSRLLNQVMRMPDIQVKVFQGYSNYDVYFANLAHSKVTFTYTRRPSNTPTRGLEALAMGCALAVPKGNVLNLFVGEESGVLFYSPDGKDLPQAIYRIVRNWAEFGPRAQRGAEIIRREFATAQVGSQYLRFAAFLAARPRKTRQRIPAETLDQRRLVKWKGWLPGEEGGELYCRLRKSNLIRWRGQWKEMDPRLVNLTGREVFLSLEAEKFHSPVSPYQGKVVSQVLQMYRICASHFPKALVLKFNWVRNALHFGNPEEVSEALWLARDILRVPPEEWHLDVLDDIYTWDYANSFFNFRRYTDLVTQHLKTGSPVKTDLVQAILASLHHYLGHYTQSLEDFQTAVRLDSDFPVYRLMLAQALIRRGGKKDLENAALLLNDLAENSILDFEAYHLLLDPETSGILQKAETIQTRALLDRMYESLLVKEPIFFTAPLQPSLIQEVGHKDQMDFGRNLSESSDEISFFIEEILRHLQNSTYGGKLTGIPFAPWGQARQEVVGPKDQLTLLKQQAINLHEKGKGVDAAKIFQQLLELQPEDMDSLISLGKIYHDQKLFAESFQYLRRAASINPQDVEVWVGIALNSIHLKDSDAFEFAKNKIRTQAPLHPILASLGRVTVMRDTDPGGSRSRKKNPSPMGSDPGEQIQKKIEVKVLPASSGEKTEATNYFGKKDPGSCQNSKRSLPLVSAIVSAYKAERFMRGLLEDLERQTIADQLEIVVVDSHSPQNEGGIVREFQKKYDNIVYLRTEERENSHVSFNRCIRMSRGKYVTLANVDDRHRPDAFERMVQVLEDHPEAGLVYADVAITDRENETPETGHIRGYYRWPDFDPALLFQICYIGPQPVWRRELHDRYGYFDPEFWYAGDYEFWLRLARKETFIHLPEVMGLYYLSSESNEHANRPQNFQESEKARERYWPKEWGNRPTPFSNKNPFAYPADSGAERIPSEEQRMNLKQQAVHFHGLGDRLGAKNAFKLALAMDPSDPDALVSLGKICLESKDYGEAMGHLQKAVQRNREDKDAWLGLALVAQKLNDLPAMQKAHAQASRLAPENPVVHSLGRWITHQRKAGRLKCNLVKSRAVLDPKVY
jgi:glycosyltransferase involved in cell wall biosynthesis/cytochrome c-type biogenesis protein CcmH/NrfG